MPLPQGERVRASRPMADMANKASTNSLVYDQLSFLEYDCQRPRLDTEWLLSTLFDASLLSTSKAADSLGGSFLAVFLTIAETIFRVAAGLLPLSAQ